MDELNSCIVINMKRRLPSLSALRSFEAAARLQSFKLAAEELSVSATSISHQVRALEEALEVRLFLRKTRAVELTPEGRILLQATGNGFDAIAAGVERLRREQHRSVTLSTTPSFAARWLVPRLQSFNAEHPGIALNVLASNKPPCMRNG
jgi:LysR family glycine cleavage system transcriptional activator